MKNNGVYIKITDHIDEEIYSPSDEEIKLDNFSEEEYNTPYTSYNEDLLDFGESIEAIGIFDDR